MAKTIGYVKNNKIRKKLSKEMSEKLESARDRLIHGMDYRQMRREEVWRQSLAQYENKTGWDRREDETMDILNINISFSTINTIVPYVADENAEFIIRPASRDALPENAAILSAYINNLWRSPEMEGRVETANAVWDSLVLGDGFAQIEWRIKEEPQYDASGDLLPGRGIEKCEYNVARVNPWDVWIDPYSDGIHNARWVCRRIMVPLKELKNDDRYTMTADLGGSDIGSMNDGFDPEDQERLDYFAGAGGWVAIYEFYDTVENWMIAFPMDSGSPFRYIEGIRCPIVHLGNYRIPNSPYHFGDLEMIASLQDELNKTRSQMITHRRRNIAKWIYRRDFLDDDGINAMKSSIINDAIPVDGNEPFERLIQQVTATPLTADVYNIDGIIRNDINEITGVNEYLRGSPQDISRTATEASIIEGATNVRTRHKLIQVELFARRIGQMLLDIMTDTLPLTDFEEMSMYITGRQAQSLNRQLGNEDINTDVIVTPTPETFQGSYVVDVEAGSTELRSPERLEQRYKEMFTILTNAAPLLFQMGVSVNIRRPLELWFEAAGIQDIDAMFESDQQQQMLQALAMQQQMQAAAQGGQPSGPGGPVRGAPTMPGDPRAATTQAPAEQPNPSNSGMLAPSY